jgi:hypothetical protein
MLPIRSSVQSFYFVCSFLLCQCYFSVLVLRKAMPVTSSIDVCLYLYVIFATPFSSLAMAL